MIRGTTALVFNLTLALKNVTDSDHPAPSSSSAPTITTTAGYRHHPVHTAVQQRISGCLEGYAGSLFWVLKKPSDIHKNVSQPSDPVEPLRPLKCWFINSWLHTNCKGFLSELPTLKFVLLTSLEDMGFSVRAIYTQTSSLCCEMICRLGAVVVAVK